MPCCSKFLARVLTLLSLTILVSSCTTTTQPPLNKPLDTKAADVKRHDAFKERESLIRAENEALAKQAEEVEVIDTWDILKNGFNLQIETSPHAQAFERWLTKHPKHIARLNKRVKLVLPYIVEEVQSRQLPMELALVPMIESSLNTFATSHASAAGLWQIMPKTGKWLGLKIGGGIDERRNILESTRVSLDYLEYLTDYYDGNWALGITAYNAGNGNVNKALRRAGKTNSYQLPWKLPLKNESKEYLAKIIGLRNYIIKTGNEYPAFTPLPLEDFFTVSRTAPSRSFVNIAKQYNSDIEIISYLNADYLSQKTSRNRTTILIPKDFTSPVIAEEFAIAEIKPTLRKHKIRKGESLSVIAQKYNTTVSKLRRLNALKGNLIRVGKVLQIPIY